MARTPACRSRCRNPLPTVKDEPTGSVPIGSSDTYNFTLTVFHISTFAPPATSIPAFAPATVVSTVRYSKADLQRIFKTVLETKPHASTLWSLVRFKIKQ